MANRIRDLRGIEPGGPSPTVESRLAAIEAELGECHQVIRSQAADLAIGIRNAQRLRSSRERLSQLGRRMGEARKIASEAKKAYEAGVAEHFDLEREIDSPQGQLPFAPEPETETEPQPSGEHVPDPDLALYGDWRRIPLDRLGIAHELPAAIVDLLHQSGLSTVGDLSSFLKPDDSDRCRDMTEIPGIGPAKALRIDQAMDELWETRAIERPRAIAADDDGGGGDDGDGDGDREWDGDDDSGPFGE